MSKGWKGGSTRAWRTLRSQILFRDGGLCQLKLEGCAVYADQVHHLDGVKAGLLCPPNRLQAACSSCNQKLGDPTRDSSRTARKTAPPDPAPNPPRTNW